jgi:predicted DCC family thiol-disulfide oxidoreductase YuxK
MEGASVVIVLILIFAAAMMMWHYARGEQMLERWARDNGYEIVASERRWFRRGPFFWWTGKGQEVFYVTVRTADGRNKRGWVRCGNWFLGMLVSEAEVRWDE